MYFLRVLCPHGTSAKPARGATMHSLQQSSEVVAAAAIADSDALEVSTAGTASAMPVLVFVLAAVAVTSVIDPRLQGLRMSADRMADHAEATGDYKRRCRIVTILMVSRCQVSRFQSPYLVMQLVLDQVVLDQP